MDMVDVEALIPHKRGCPHVCLIVSIENQTIAMCIDARLPGDLTLCVSRKIFKHNEDLI